MESDSLTEESNLLCKDENEDKSYGLAVAISGKGTENEFLIADQVTKENKQKVIQLNLSKKSPIKIDTSKNMSTELTENQMLPKTEDVNAYSAGCKDIDVANDIPSVNTVQTNEMKEKAPRKHLQLHLNVDAASKKILSFKDTTLDSLATPTSRGTPKPMNVAVFLKEGDHRLLLLEKGKFTTAGELKTMMLENLSIPRGAADVFAIWFISPYLEIQLKDHHIPFLLRKQWPELLISFSTCQESVDAVNDEPVLVFQRNSFLTVNDEEKYQDETIIKRLFEEARYNILMSRYPIPIADAEMLGGILVRIEEGKFDGMQHKPGYFKKQLSNFLPYYAIGSNKFVQFLKSTSSEQRLLVQFEHVTKKAMDIKTCQKTYLEYCRSLPFYGCAFFKGKIDQDVKGYKPWKTCEKQAIVGINRNGLSIFRTSKEELLIHLSFDDLSWDYIKDTSAECLDTFLIEYDLLDDSKETTSQQIHLLSRQACMMDAMVNSCVNYMNMMKIPITPTSVDRRKLLDISYNIHDNNKKNNFSLSRPFKT